MTPRSTQMLQLEDSIQRLFDRYRTEHGDDDHGDACTAIINGVANSLAQATGDRNATEVLYRAGDKMAVRKATLCHYSPRGRMIDRLTRRPGA